MVARTASRRGSKGRVSPVGRSVFPGSAESSCGALGVLGSRGSGGLWGRQWG